MAKKESFIIIDGNALLHRAFHALPPMTTKDGTLVNAVYGFTTTLLKIIKELKPDYLCAAFDRKGVSRRAEEFTAYKAQRIKQPDELYTQIPLIEEVLAAFNIPVVESLEVGWEADDVIGSVVTELKKQTDIQKIIVTGDLDTLQLVNGQTEIFTMKKGLSETITYDEKGVIERFGLTAAQMIDYKALRGDPSDNIPGVSGIGEKTAIDLLKNFNTLENIYEAIDHQTKKLSEIKSGVLEKLKLHREDAFLSKKIVTINTSLETDFDLDKTKLEPFDKEKVAKVFRQLEFKSLLAKINDLAIQTQSSTTSLASHVAGQATMSLSTTSQIQKQPGQQKVNYQLIADAEAFKILLKKLGTPAIITLDTETTSLNVFEAKLLGISLSWQEGLAYYLSIKDLPENSLNKLGQILNNKKIVGHNLKYDYAILCQAGLTMPAENLYFDTLIAAYLLTSANRNLDLDSLAFTEFGYTMQPIEDLLGLRGKDQLTMDQVPVAKVSWYSCEDVDFTFRLFKKYEPAIKAANNQKLFQDVEMPLIAVLADIEKTGILIDKEFLKNLAKEFSKDIKTIEQKVYKMAGQEFNLASPLQLKEILFDKLQISTKGLKKTKTGISTAAGELEKMSGLHPIIDLMSEFRELSKLQNTYIEALPEQTDEHGRIHTSFNQTVTSTGRLSSSNPNLQNIPIRTPLGQQIRKAFIAPKGFRLLSADYSQIELRIIASLSGDQNMIETFKRHEDIHAKTAAFIHNVALDKVDSFQRRSAKEINFGIIYGLGSTGLAQRAKISRDQAKDFIAKYFAGYPKIKAWLDETKVQARELGYVETLFGRRRYLPEINSTVPMIRASAERMAINAPIQGTAADLLKMAMVKVWLGLPKISTKSKILLTVHDELVLEVPNEDIPAVSAFVQTTMENVCQLKVPIKVHIEAGKNWQEAK